jgi:hypothetical protein
MKKFLVVGLRILGLLLVAHALMLIGADEISTLESGGIRTIRSLDEILTLYRLNPKPWEATLPPALGEAIMRIFALPGWAVLAAVGGVIGLLARPRD